MNWLENRADELQMFNSVFKQTSRHNEASSTQNEEVLEKFATQRTLKEQETGR